MGSWKCWIDKHPAEVDTAIVESGDARLRLQDGTPTGSGFTLDMLARAASAVLPDLRARELPRLQAYASYITVARNRSFPLILQIRWQDVLYRMSFKYNQDQRQVFVWRRGWQDARGDWHYEKVTVSGYKPDRHFDHKAWRAWMHADADRNCALKQAAAREATR